MIDGLGDPNAEGVYTVLPGTQTKAYRYSSRDAVPLLLRPLAVQRGAAGYWYVPTPDTPHEIWDRITGGVATTVEDASEAIGADRGVLGVFSKLLGIPYPLSVLLVIVLAFALLRGAGLVPPLSALVKE